MKYKATSSTSPNHAERVLGKIKSVRFGMVGYQESILGLEIELTSKSGDCIDLVHGGWAYGRITPDKNSQWAEGDRTEAMTAMCKNVCKILEDAGEEDVSSLQGKPVEIIFSSNQLQSWRILTEVL